MTDARLQELYQRMLDARGDAHRLACPAPEALQTLVERQGGEQRRLEILDHVMSCRECMAEFELLRSLRAAEPRDRGWRPATLALAASVLITVAAGVLGVRSLSHRPGGVARGGGAHGDVQLISPAATVSAAAPVVLRWHAIPQAISYSLEVLTADGATVMDTAATADTSFILPATVHLLPSRSYAWWVRAHLADGSERSSEMRSLRVGP